MNTHFYLPGDEAIDMFLAEFIGYFWCRYLDGQVVGQKIVRFLVSSEQFEECRKKWGATGVVPATGDEPIEQLAFKPVPPFHDSRDEMAKVERKLEEKGLWTIYMAKVREETAGRPVSGTITAGEMWRMLTASPTSRARAAFLVVDSQRPKQQALFG
jgi:hypothetical protein